MCFQNAYQTHSFLYSVLSSLTLPVQIEVVSEQSFEETICTTQERKWQGDKSYMADSYPVDTAIKIILSEWDQAEWHVMWKTDRRKAYTVWTTYVRE